MVHMLSSPEDEENGGQQTTVCWAAVRYDVIV